MVLNEIDSWMFSMTFLKGPPIWIWEMGNLDIDRIDVRARLCHNFKFFVIFTGGVANNFRLLQKMLDDIVGWTTIYSDANILRGNRAGQPHTEHVCGIEYTSKINKE